MSIVCIVWGSRQLDCSYERRLITLILCQGENASTDACTSRSSYNEHSCRCSPLVNDPNAAPVRSAVRCRPWRSKGTDKESERHAALSRVYSGHGKLRKGGGSGWCYSI